ncbi:unnamed protein product [Allacma fusca]|uniref:Uncharacterized protein n=1 Tax=Allacma fusca TaxID=39272 RepID=A0A8J2KG14_9HEXA|nr:unnamed protein product [Allacma fusca]
MSAERIRPVITGPLENQEFTTKPGALSKTLSNYYPGIDGNYKNLAQRQFEVSQVKNKNSKFEQKSSHVDQISNQKVYRAKNKYVEGHSRKREENTFKKLEEFVGVPFIFETAEFHSNLSTLKSLPITRDEDFQSGLILKEKSGKLEVVEKNVFKKHGTTEKIFLSSIKYSDVKSTILGRNNSLRLNPRIKKLHMKKLGRTKLHLMKPKPSKILPAWFKRQRLARMPNVTFEGKPQKPGKMPRNHIHRTKVSKMLGTGPRSSTALKTTVVTSKPANVPETLIVGGQKFPKDMKTTFKIFKPAKPPDVQLQYLDDSTYAPEDKRSFYAVVRNIRVPAENKFLGFSSAAKIQSTPEVAKPRPKEAHSARNRGHRHKNPSNKTSINSNTIFSNETICNSQTTCYNGNSSNNKSNYNKA